MVADLEIAGRDPLAGWSLVCVAGKDLLGRLEGRTLRHVYQYQAQVQQLPNGSIGIGRICLPLMMLASLDQLELPEGAGAIVLPCEGLDRDEQHQLRKAMLQCDEMVRSMRAAAAGIVVARGRPG